MPWLVTAAAAAAVVLLLLTWLKQQQHRQHSSSSGAAAACPPRRVPRLPLLGNTIALGAGGLAFITQCRRRFGDAFALSILGEEFVFVFHPAAVGRFFRAPESEVSFKAAAERFTERVICLPAAEFSPSHERLLLSLRELLSPDKMAAMMRALHGHATRVAAWRRPEAAAAGGGGGASAAAWQLELWPACQRLQFGAAARVLFGEAMFARHGEGPLLELFLDFEGNFELAASPVPHLLLPRFRRARRGLLRMLRASVAAGDFAGTVAGALVDGCGLPARLHANVLLAVLWASQANSIAALFWALAFLSLPQHAAWQRRVRGELRAKAAELRRSARRRQQQQQQKPAGDDGGDGNGSMDAAADADDDDADDDGDGDGDDDASTAAAAVALALDAKAAARRCVAEAIRLRAHSIAVRRVVAPGGVMVRVGSSAADGGGGGGVVVPCGATLAICPVESHVDEAVFGPHARDFDPGRAQGGADLEPRGAVAPGLAGCGFGGGWSRCPGRAFAEAELALLVTQVLAAYELRGGGGDVGGGGAVDGGDVCGSGGGGGAGSWLSGLAVFGCGARGGAAREAAEWQTVGARPPPPPPPPPPPSAEEKAAPDSYQDGAAAAAARKLWRAPPRMELRRLVGFKCLADADASWAVEVRPARD